jgi:hypothetical protein
MKGHPGTSGITMEYGRLPGHPLTSVAVILKLKTPGVVGVPEIRPVDGLRVRPFGSAPDEMVKVYGGIPPVAETVWL